MAEKVCFLKLSERDWQYIESAAAEKGQQVEDWISGFISAALAEGVPTMKEGSAKTDLPSEAQRKQISRGLDKNHLLCAFVREGEAHRLYFKQGDNTHACYAHLIIGVTGGGKTVWDVRGQFYDIQTMGKDIIYDLPGWAGVLDSIIHRRQER